MKLQATFIGLLGTLLAPLAAQDADAPPEQQLATRVLEALADDDTDAVRELANDDQVDPYLILIGLRLRELTGRNEDDAQARRAAELVADSVADPHIAKMMRRWLEQWSDPQRDTALDRRVARLARDVRGLNAEDHAAEILEQVAATREELELTGEGPVTFCIALEEAQALSVTGRHPEAEELLREIVRSARELPWAALEAQCWLLISDTAHGADDHSRALRILEDAYEVFEAVDVGSMWRRYYLRIARVHHAMGRTDEAIASLVEGRSRASAAGELEDVAHFEKAIAEDEIRRSDYDAAIAAFNRALDIWRELERQSEVANRLQGLALAQIHARRYEEALENLETGIALNREIGDSSGEAHGLLDLAMLEEQLGRTERALENYERALALGQQLNDRSLVAYTRASMYSVVQALRGDEAAIECAERGLAELEALGERHAAATTRTNLGFLYHRVGRSRDAREMLRDAIEDQRELGNRRDLAVTLSNYGSVLIEQGEMDAALERLENARQIFAELKLSYDVSVTWHRIGLIRFRRGEFVAALDCMSRSLGLKLREGTGLAEAERLGLRAKVKFAAGNLLHAAFRVINTRGPTEEEKDHAVTEGYAAMEFSKAFVLADGLLNWDRFVDDALPPALVTAERRAVERLRAAQSAFTAAASRAKTNDGALEDLQREIDAAYRELEDLTARIEREHRRVAELIRPMPPSLRELRHTLPERTALISYHLIENGPVAAFVCSPEGLLLAELAGTVPVVDRAERFVRLSAVPGSRWQPTARELYDALLRPLEIYMPDVDRLLISPDGALTHVPFEALVRTAGDGEQLLIERCEIVYVPSVTTYVALQKREEPPNADALLALGDPIYPAERDAPGENVMVSEAAAERGVGDLQRLVGSGEEVRALAELYPPGGRTVLLREQATRAGLMEALRQTDNGFDAVHLACHGHVDLQRPRLTGLVLGGAEILTLDDVYRARIPARLVVLSACESGRGRIAGGEGVIGLTRGFFYAGVPRVVVSNWKVRDDATRALMTAFYRGMRENGLTPAAALRSAKRARIAAGNTHPADWAAFVLWGREN